MITIVCRHCRESVSVPKVELHQRNCAELNRKLRMIRKEYNEKEYAALSVAAEGMRGYA
jgi:hypothetical protein